MSDWVREPTPKDKGFGDGWCGELDRCWRKGNKYVVMSRRIKTAWGVVEHVCIKTHNQDNLSWKEKQMIKNALFGRQSTAIEVFPAADRLIDVAYMYHLWVLPEGFNLPFGLHEGDSQGEAVSR